jgi:hypothetical protein
MAHGPRLYLRNLYFNVARADVEYLLRRRGHPVPVGVHVVRKGAYAEHKMCSAFVEMSSQQEVDRAVADLNGLREPAVCKYSLYAEAAEPLRERSRTPAGAGACAAQAAAGSAARPTAKPLPTAVRAKSAAEPGAAAQPAAAVPAQTPAAKARPPGAVPAQPRAAARAEPPGELRLAATPPWRRGPQVLPPPPRSRAQATEEEEELQEPDSPATSPADAVVEETLRRHLSDS